MKYNDIEKSLAITTDIFNQPVDKMMEYIYELGMTYDEIKFHFNNYIKKYKLAGTSLKKILDKYKKYLKSINSNSSLRTGDFLIKSAVDFYETMISKGYFCKSLYIKSLVSDIDSYNCLGSLVSDYEQCLSRMKLLSFYKSRLEDNRALFYDKNCVMINSIKEKLSDKSLDIIDFYLISKMDVDNFKILCKGFWSNYEMGLLNIFSQKYSDIVFSLNDVYKNKYNINGVDINDVDKSKVVNFLNENKIPICYFGVALIKYTNGELDDYFGKVLVKG